MVHNSRVITNGEQTTTTTCSGLITHWFKITKCAEHKSTKVCYFREHLTGTIN